MPVSLCSLGSFSTPKTVYGQGYAYAIDRDAIYWTVSDQAGTNDPSKYVMRTAVDRSNGFKLLNAEEIWDPQGNLGWNFDLYFETSGLAYRYTGYGTTQEPCGGTKGVIFRSPLLDKYLCLCDGYYNCNLTSNVGRCYYDINTGYLICDGADGSRNIWIIDKELTTAKRLTHGEALVRGRFSCIPYFDGTDDYLLCALTGGASGTNRLRIFKFKINDAVNANDGTDVSTLSSYELIYSSDSLNSTARNVINSNGFLAFIDTGSEKIILDVNLQITELNDNVGARDVVGVTQNGLLYETVSGSTVTIYEYTKNGITQVSQLSNSNYESAMSREWGLFTNINSGSTTVEAYTLCEGSQRPILYANYKDQQIYMMDYLTWSIMQYDVIVVPSRLITPRTWQGASLPLSTKAKFVSNVQGLNPGDYLENVPYGLNALVAWRTG